MPVYEFIAPAGAQLEYVLEQGSGCGYRCLFRSVGLVRQSHRNLHQFVLTDFFGCQIDESCIDTVDQGVQTRLGFHEFIA